jgi:hypothetical protein
MKIQIEQKVTVILELTEAEALWLKVHLQNSVDPDEDRYNGEMRSRFWNALNSYKELK